MTNATKMGISLSTMIVESIHNAPVLNFAQMIGVVLSGGQSSRMGRDKGLIEANGKPWAKIAFEKLTAVDVPALVSVNQHQLQEYLRYFDKEQLIIDRADLKIQGPLAGVLGAHLSHTNQDILVLACDMINLQPAVLAKLTNEYQQHQPEAIAFKGEHVEPLCAIYSSRALRKIKMQYAGDTLKSHSLKTVLGILETKFLPISKEWQPLFKSINRAEDLR
jgi:molybdopterin-guanine dinucleotide biosynthesis protein A